MKLIYFCGSDNTGKKVLSFGVEK